MANDFDRGRRVGKYELLTRISVGGMAELYLAFLPGLAGFKKFFALKQILPDLRDDEHFVQMFLDEARISALLSHPNIGQVFDLGRDDASGELYLAMEFITGQNLSSLRKAAGRVGIAVPVPVACRIAHDLCLGLHAAHTFVDPSGRAHPIVHRDVAPKNVMVSYSGHVKVIDFGIAKARGRLMRTQAGQVRGTPSYMAPEQWREQPVDARTDLYAVGHILNELLTGERRPPVATPEAALLLSRELPVDPSLKNKNVSAQLGALVVRSIANRPEERVQTGKDFARALEQACPELADEWQVSTFISQLFEPQVASSQALFEAAQQDAPPERISGLVKKLSEENPVPPQPEPEPEPEGERITLTAAAPIQPAPSRGWLSLGVILFVIAAGAAVAVALDRPGATPAPAPEELETVPLRAPGVTAALQRAERAMGAREFSEAEAAWEEVLAVEPSNWPALFGAGVAARRLAHRDRAEARLGAALERVATPRQKAMAHFELGCLAAQQGQSRAALDQLQQAVDLLGLEVFAEALKTEEDLAALRNDPEFKRLGGVASGKPAAPAVPSAPAASARQLLDEGLAAVRTGSFAVAVARFEKCVKVDPLSHACYLGLGNAHTRLNHREEARVAYRRYLEVAPGDDPFIPKVKELLGQ